MRRPGTHNVTFGGELGPKGRCKTIDVHGCDVTFTPYQCRITAPVLNALVSAPSIDTATVKGVVYEIVEKLSDTSDMLILTGRTKD